MLQQQVLYMQFIHAMPCAWQPETLSGNSAPQQRKSLLTSLTTLSISTASCLQLQHLSKKR